MLSQKEKIDGKFGFVLTHNVKGNSITDWVKRYKENELTRLRKRKDSVMLNHFMLSFHRNDRDHLDPEILKDITQKFIEEHNINGMYVAVPHMTQDHFHVHVCASGIELASGKSMRMSKAEFSSLKTRVQEYQMQMYPELENSVVDHDGSIKKKKKKPQKETRDFLKSTYDRLFKESVDKVSHDDRLQALRDEGIEFYERGGKTYGMTYEGSNYRFSTMGIDHEMEAPVLPTRPDNDSGSQRSQSQTQTQASRPNQSVSDDSDAPPPQTSAAQTRYSQIQSIRRRKDGRDGPEERMAP